jgi:hypothetical protein
MTRVRYARWAPLRHSRTDQNDFQNQFKNEVFPKKIFFFEKKVTPKIDQKMTKNGQKTPVCFPVLPQNTIFRTSRIPYLSRARVAP